MTQSSLWHNESKSTDYAELCNALYERELGVLSSQPFTQVEVLQGRLKSLPYYVQRTAHQMILAETPLSLDAQNGMWQTKQSKSIPLTGQAEQMVWEWYCKAGVNVGLVVPVLKRDHISLDCIDRIDEAKGRIRTNYNGWFSVEQVVKTVGEQPVQLLKPTKKVMMAACAGHAWKNNALASPKIPSMRELLLSCSINWRNFKQPMAINSL